MTAELLDEVVQHHIVNSLGWPALRPLQEAAVAPVLRGDDALLLKDVGCSSNAARIYQLFGGDDHAAPAHLPQRRPEPLDQRPDSPPVVGRRADGAAAGDGTLFEQRGDTLPGRLRRPATRLGSTLSC